MIGSLQGFLTAMRQEITRSHKGWSLDNVVLANDVMKMLTKEEVTQPPAEGVYVYGLKIDGAAWRMSREKGGHLSDPPPKQLYSDLPVVHVCLPKNILSLQISLSSSRSMQQTNQKHWVMLIISVPFTRNHVVRI